jgi:hypothetical protein
VSYADLPFSDKPNLPNLTEFLKINLYVFSTHLDPSNVVNDIGNESESARVDTICSFFFQAHERAFPAMSSRGYVKVNNELVTKHDVTMSGRRNACRVMESFPPCIHTGDGASFDMQLSNKVSALLSKERKITHLHFNTVFLRFLATCRYTTT